MQKDENDLAATAGFYTPTFFKMHIDTEDSLDKVQKITDRNAALYIHEYIHYLQDISTTYGLFNICANINHIRESALQIRSTGENTFYVPIFPSAKDEHQVFYTLLTKRGHLGDGNSINLELGDTISDIEISERTITLGLNAGHNINVVTIRFTSSLTYEFGATSIMECVAYIVESVLYPDAVEVPYTLPYNTVNLLVNHIYPEFGANKLNILALADASLFVLSPGHFFYIVLTKMKETSYLPESPNDIYEYVNRVDFSYEGQNTVEGILKLMAERASGMMEDFFKDPSFSSTIIWIKETLHNALDLRIKTREFILEIVAQGKLSGNAFFLSIMEKVGTPMIINSLQEVWFYPCVSSQKLGVYQDMRPDILWAINQIYKLFARGQVHCEMMEYCQRTCEELGKPDITDQRCVKSPWKRVESGPACAYSQVWHMWKLTETTPVNRN